MKLIATASESRSHNSLHTSLRTSLRIFSLICFTSLLVFVFWGCGKKKSTRPENPTAAQYTTAGWEKFAESDYAGALTRFNNAVATDPDHGPAYTGLGWTILTTADNTADLSSSRSYFTSAANHGDQSADMFAGAAAANLGAGTATADALAAIAAGQSLLEIDPQYIFTPRPDFDADQIRLIIAFAQAELGEFSQALAAADYIADSGIDQNDPVSWQVDGFTYQSFAQAVLAFLASFSPQEVEQDSEHAVRTETDSVNKDKTGKSKDD